MTGNSNLQVGLVATRTRTFTFVGAPGGSLIADPATVTAGGVTVTATVESAGMPTDFDLIAGISVGMPIITLPIKIHLVSLPGQRWTWGRAASSARIRTRSSCTRRTPTCRTRLLDVVSFDPDGTPNPNGPLSSLVVSGTTQGDSTFSVPAASGCGPNGDGSLDGAVNAVVGLPSPSGTNNLVLDDASSALAFPRPSAPSTGQQFSDYWHIAFD